MYSQEGWLMKKIAVVFCLAAVLLCVASPVYAASGVAVQVPQFAVMLNDKVYDNQHAKYPLLVYNECDLLSYDLSVDPFAGAGDRLGRR